MSNRYPFAFMLALAIGTLAHLPDRSTATTMKYVDLPELVESSDVILRGRVGEQTSFVSDETGRMTTHVSIEVAEVYHGEIERERVEVEQWGGTVDGRTLQIPGDAQFQEGERVLLFLDYDRDSGKYPLYLVAMTQSKFHIEERNGETVIFRSPDGVHVIGSKEKDAPNLAAPSSFDAFEARLQTLIDSLEKRGGGDDR